MPGAITRRSLVASALASMVTSAGPHITMRHVTGKVLKTMAVVTWESDGAVVGAAVGAFVAGAFVTGGTVGLGVRVLVGFGVAV